jgi:LEA14-like dessication related protein
MTRRAASLTSMLLAMLAVSACASLGMGDPPNVTVAGIEPLEGQGLEMRMLVKLRVQNPNDSVIDYNGVAVKLEVRGKTFATGVSDATGSVPRFGESVIGVPVTISAMNMAKQVFGMMGGKPLDKLDYSLTGKLSGSMFSTVHFKSAGTLDMPKPPVGATGNVGQ